MAAIGARRARVQATYRLARNTDALFRWGTAIALAEFTVVFVSVAIGTLIHAGIVLGCAAAYLRFSDAPSHRVLLPLALVSVSRMLGLTMPLEELPTWAWYALAGAPLLVGAGLMTVRLGAAGRVGLERPSAIDAMSVGVGVVLGIVAAVLGIGPRLDAGLDPGAFVLTAAALALFVAVPEELVYRGLLQRHADDAHGIAGVVMVSVLYATMFLSSFSVAVVALMGLAGATFAWAIRQGGTLWGTIAGHSSLIIGASLVWSAVVG